MTKTILLIGAGLAQKGAVETAHRLGHHVVAVDGDPEADGLALADESVVHDLKDIEGLVDLGRQRAVDGVLAVASDFCLPIAARVAARLGLPGLPVEVADMATNKGLLRREYTRHGVPGPAFRLARRPEDLAWLFDELGSPCVLKPVDSAGSRGVSLVRDEAGLAAAFQEALGYSQSGEVIAEAFMPGEEVAVEAFVSRGEVRILCLSDKVRTPPPHLLDEVVLFPTARPAEQREAIRNVALQAIAALRVDNAPVHMELMMTSEGPKVVDVAARGAGFKVYTEILPALTGFDGVEAQIRALFGETPAPDRTPRHGGACLAFFGSNRAGTLRDIEREPAPGGGQVEIAIYAQPGQAVLPLHNGSARLGHVLAFGRDRREAEELANQAMRSVTLHID